jgi:predicted PurR-regulated permease PerM
MNPETRTPSKLCFFSTYPRSAITSWILTGIALFLVLKLHLLSALMAGLLTYELVRLLTPLVEKRLTSKGARLVALAALSVLTITLVILLTVGMFAFFKSDTGNRQALLDKTNHILTDARTKLPLWIVDNWPSNVDAMKSYASEWVDEHSKEIQQAGKEVVHFFVRGLVGMVIGALISLHAGPAIRQMRPLAAALALRISRFANAFRLIIFAR